MTDLTLTTERTINAAQADVFNAWLDPDMLRRFMIAGEGTTVPRARTDAKTGGTFEIIMKVGGDEIPHRGTYKAIDPHDRIAFTWESPFSDANSVVTVTFATVSGGTHVTLTHVRFPSEESRDNHKGGWTKILAALDDAVGKGKAA